MVTKIGTKIGTYCFCMQCDPSGESPEMLEDCYGTSEVIELDENNVDEEAPMRFPICDNCGEKIR